MNNLPMKDNKPDLERLAKTMCYMDAEAKLEPLQALLNWQREQDAKVAERRLPKLNNAGDAISYGMTLTDKKRGANRAAEQIAQAIRNQGEGE